MREGRTCGGFKIPDPARESQECRLRIIVCGARNQLNQLNQEALWREPGASITCVNSLALLHHRLRDTTTRNGRQKSRRKTAGSNITHLFWRK